MICEFDLCVHNENNACLLTEIYVTAFGVCGECMVPHIGADVLAAAKRETLERLSRVYGDLPPAPQFSDGQREQRQCES